MGKQVVARLNGGLAQLGEHLPCKQGVESSNLLVSTVDIKSTSRTLKTEYRRSKYPTSALGRKLFNEDER